MITGIVIWFDMDDVSAFGLLFGELNEARVHERKLFYQNFQGGRRLVWAGKICQLSYVEENVGQAFTNSVLDLLIWGKRKECMIEVDNEVTF